MRACVLAILLLLSAIKVTWANDEDICSGRQGDSSMAACTRLIDSGRLGARDKATIHVLRASIYRSEGNYDAAIADFTRAIRLLEGSAAGDVVASAYLTRANAYALKGDLHSARADYRKALELEPTNAQAAQELARIEASLIPQTPERPADGAPAVAAPNEPLPRDVPIAPEVLRVVETHPFFSNSPPVLVGRYTIDGIINWTDKDTGTSGNTTSNKRAIVRWLRPGLVRLETTDRGSVNYFSQLPPSKSVTEETFVAAANGLIELSAKWAFKPGAAKGTRRVTRIDGLENSVFPISLGNRFSYRLTGSISSDGSYEYMSETDCEVTRKYGAGHFNPELTGSAYLLTCEERILKRGEDPATVRSNKLFFESLGIWIEVDPVSGGEQLVANDFDGKHVLKSFALAR